MKQLSSNTAANAAVVAAERLTARAFEMPDDSMHPRIRRGDFALLDECGGVEATAGEEALVQFTDGQWRLRTVVKYSGETVTLSAFNPPAEETLSRNSISAIYRVDMIVPPRTFTLMTDSIDVWEVRDAHGNDYGTFPSHGEAVDFGKAVMKRLGLEEISFCCAEVSAADFVKAEASHG
jgi:hypothetical protein